MVLFVPNVLIVVVKTHDANACVQYLRYISLRPNAVRLVPALPALRSRNADIQYFHYYSYLRRRGRLVKSVPILSACSSTNSKNITNSKSQSHYMYYQEYMYDGAGAVPAVRSLPSNVPKRNTISTFSPYSKSQRPNLQYL